jgi:hypothetical protein
VATSQNGYPANDRSVIVSYAIPGGKVALRRGAAGELLAEAARRWHNEVEPLVWPGNWGYAERMIRGSTTTLSNHASGTAIDLNAPKHPLGTDPRKNFTPAALAALRRIVDESEGCIRAGAFYTGRADGMHLEAMKGEADCARVLAKWRGGKIAGLAAPKPVALKFPVVGSIAAAFQRVGGLAVLGQPVGPEVPTADPKGRWQNFGNGRIYWHPQILKGDAHAVMGQIEQRFKALGVENGVGWPTTDEGKCADGVGRYNHFLRGTEVSSIYWSPTTRAQWIRGAIRSVWAGQGFETGKLGYPVSEEVAAQGGVVQEFQYGTILWKDGRAATALK